MLSIEHTFFAFQVAASAAALLWLTEPGQLFEKYGQWLARMEWKIDARLLKPIGACPRCFAGQAGFWIGAATFGPSLKIITFTLTVITIHETIQKWRNK